MTSSDTRLTTLPNGIRVISEAMPRVHTLAMGVWVDVGTRYEPAEVNGVAHLLEHMAFKGTHRRTAWKIASEIENVGGEINAATSVETTSFYARVLADDVPLAIDILADIVRNPAFGADDIEREKKVVLEEIKMVEDTPDDLVHELFTQGFWENHPLGRPILGTKETVESFNAPLLRDYFGGVYTAKNLIISAVGNLEHDRVRELVAEKFGSLAAVGEPAVDEVPQVVPKILVRNKELEQSHVCLGVGSYPQDHEDRYASYVLNTLLGGSMSSRLFQNVREKRGLAYAVFSGLSAYRDAGSFTIYAGCANEAVGEVIDLCVEELRGVKNAPVPDSELQRSKDHLKGSLMLSLENTASRMSHLARQEIYFDRQFGLDETLVGIERVTTADVQRVAADLFRNGSLSATVLGNVNGLKIPAGRLDLD